MCPGNSIPVVIIYDSMGAITKFDSLSRGVLNIVSYSIIHCINYIYHTNYIKKYNFN